MILQSRLLKMPKLDVDVMSVDHVRPDNSRNVIGGTWFLRRRKFGDFLVDILWFKRPIINQKGWWRRSADSDLRSFSFPFSSK